MDVEEVEEEEPIQEGPTKVVSININITVQAKVSVAAPVVCIMQSCKSGAHAGSTISSASPVTRP
jgi:hypothetical protein